MQTQREKEIELLVDYFISFCPGNSDVMDKYINEDHDINEKIDRLMQDKILVGEAEKIFAKTPQRKAIEERFKKMLKREGGADRGIEVKILAEHKEKACTLEHDEEIQKHIETISCFFGFTIKAEEIKDIHALTNMVRENSHVIRAVEEISRDKEKFRTSLEEYCKTPQFQEFVTKFEALYPEHKKL